MMRGRLRATIFDLQRAGSGLIALVAWATAVGFVSAQTGGETAGAAQEPAPRWACNQQTLTAEPIWRGQRGVTFDFDIRNTGTAPLVIKAQGG